MEERICEKDELRSEVKVQGSDRWWEQYLCFLISKCTAVVRFQCVLAVIVMCGNHKVFMFCVLQKVGDNVSTIHCSQEISKYFIIIWLHITLCQLSAATGKLFCKLANKIRYHGALPWRPSYDSTLILHCIRATSGALSRLGVLAISVLVSTRLDTETWKSGPGLGLELLSLESKRGS